MRNLTDLIIVAGFCETHHEFSMANKLLVDTNVAGKQLNKQQLYANINTKLTKLT